MQETNSLTKVQIEYIKIAMLLINIVAVLFVAILINVTTNRICSHYIAREFMDGIEAVPDQPVRMVSLLVVMLVLSVVSYICREFIWSNHTKVVYLTFIFEMVVGFYIVYLLNFNYNGIILLVFANVVTYTKGVKGRFVLIFLAIASFLVADYELISINYRLYSVHSYINYYDAATQQYLLGFYNVLISLNIITFILYCVRVIQEQQGTIHEVNRLYDELSKVNEDLQNANIQLRDYATITEKMGETKERNRLAREIHDTLGHTLTGISAGLDACIATVENSPQVTKKQLEIISNVTREGINEVRRSVNELRPDSLERLSLEYAIRKMINDINSLTNTTIEFDCEMDNLKFDEDEENIIYRVIQESITNSIRHGNASKIWVQIDKLNAEIKLHIKDNGSGCEQINPGFGIKHMMERIGMLNGTVSFNGEHGFEVDVRIPIRWGEEYD